MGTRCGIRIIDEAGKYVELYHHWDGYISGVGYDLLDMFYDKESNKLIMDDFIDNLVNKLIKNKDDDGYEFCSATHADIEYMYTINIGKNEITVDEVNNWDKKMKILKSYSYQDLLKMYKKDRGLITDIQLDQTKAIHTTRNKIGMNHDRYVNLLQAMFNVGSCKSLDSEQASILIETLSKLG